MDAKKEKSISRIKEEIELYEPIAEALKLDPGEMGHLQIPILEDLVIQHKTIIECVENDLPFMASQYTNPVEILSAMDIPWYFHLQGMFAAGGSGSSPHLMEDLEQMDRLPLPSDCCTLLRLALYYQAAGLMPVPTAYLALTEPCDGVGGLHTALMHHKDWRDVAVFAPDPPYHSDDRAIDYYADEMKRMVDFTEKVTGKTIDMKRLVEVVEETNRGYALWLEYNEIRRAKPTPHSYVMPLSCFFQINTYGAGSPSKTQWYQSMVDDAEKRVRENRPEVSDQKIRVFWYDIQPLFFSELAPWLEQEWGAPVVVDMVSYCPYEVVDTSTENSLFRGLAKRAFQDGPMIHQSRGLADNIVHDIRRIVTDYQMDCVIFPGHMGHKDMSATTSLMREVCRELEVPFLHIGMDQVDKRYATIDEIKDKISQFFIAMGLG